MKKWLPLLIGLLPLVAACSSFATSEDGAQQQNDELVVEAATATPTLRPLTEAEIIAPTPSGLSLQPKLAEADIDMNRVISLLPPDAIPAILPERAADILVSAEQAERRGIEPSLRVIGVSVNGESQAYPLPFMSRHEIVNADIGGELLAVTW